MNERIQDYLDDAERQARQIKDEATGFAEHEFREAAINILANIILIRQELEEKSPNQPTLEELELAIETCPNCADDDQYCQLCEKRVYEITKMNLGG